MTIDKDDLEFGIAGFDERFRFPHRGIAMFKSIAGAGKSTFCYCAIASLQRFIPVPIPVCYIDTEGGYSEARLTDILTGYGCFDRSGNLVMPELQLIEASSWDELKDNVNVLGQYGTPRIIILDSVGFMFRQEFWESGARGKRGESSMREAGVVVRDLCRILMDLRKVVAKNNGYGIVTNWLRSQLSDAVDTARWDFLCGDSLAYLAKVIYDLDAHPWKLGSITIDKAKNAPVGLCQHFRFTDGGVELVAPDEFNAARSMWEKAHMRVKKP